jgi:proteasome lid subunit RPN8/RPN11
MLAIDEEPWRAMAAHAIAAYPEECCGAMLGRIAGGVKRVTRAIPIQNAAMPDARRARYELRPNDVLAATAAARRSGLALIGFYHSHPDRAAYFSEADLKDSCPWYSFLVLAVRESKVEDAKCWIPSPEQDRAEREELVLPTC